MENVIEWAHYTVMEKEGMNVWSLIGKVKDG